MALGNISLRSTKSGAGEQFLLPFCKAEARAKGVFVHRHRYQTGDDVITQTAMAFMRMVAVPPVPPVPRAVSGAVVGSTVNGQEQQRHR